MNTMTEETGQKILATLEAQVGLMTAQNKLLSTLANSLMANGSSNGTRAPSGGGQAGSSNSSRPEDAPDTETPGAWRDAECPIGKHRGRKLGELPKSYLEWACKNLEPHPRSQDFHEALDIYASARGIERAGNYGQGPSTPIAESYAPSRSQRSAPPPQSSAPADEFADDDLPF
jgi:hypothetical protein